MFKKNFCNFKNTVCTIFCFTCGPNQLSWKFKNLGFLVLGQNIGKINLPLESVLELLDCC